MALILLDFKIGKLFYHSQNRQNNSNDLKI
jgi:hypothetical protein